MAPTTLKFVKKVINSIICLFIPTKLCFFLLNLLGNKIHKTTVIGFSFIWIDYLELDKNTKIGHFNLIAVTELRLKEEAYIGHFNLIKGPLKVILNSYAAIGISNTIKRAKMGIVIGDAALKLGILTKITSNHFIDCCCNVTLGDYSILAGINSQIWTHGYVHDIKGAGRFRVDGKVTVGNNVYIGSMSVINPGVSISDSITIGSSSCVSKSLSKPGLYVSQQLRFIKRDYENVKEKLTKSNEYCIEEVYIKK